MAAWSLKPKVPVKGTFQLRKRRGGLGKDMEQGEPTSPLFLSAGPNVSRREALGLSSERPCSCPLFGDSRG